MARQSVPFVSLVLFVVFAIGCSRKPDTPAADGGTPAPEPRGVDSDPNAVYSLKVRPIQKGDKTEVIRSESSTSVMHGGSGGTTKVGKRFEFVEHILEMPPEAPLPTRLTREYRIAKRATDLKTAELQPFAFEGKTVLIEKRGSSYRYSIDQKPLAQPETIELDSEFRGADKINIETLLPDEPVKLGERWPIKPDILRAFGQMSAGIDYSKSSFSGQFTRAYTIDGKQWGQITFDFEIVIDADITGGKVRGNEGTIKITGTFDFVIDGSARDSIMKGAVKGNLTGQHKAAAVKLEIDGTIEKSIRTIP